MLVVNMETEMGAAWARLPTDQAQLRSGRGIVSILTGPDADPG